MISTISLAELVMMRIFLNSMNFILLKTTALIKKKEIKENASKNL